MGSVFASSPPKFDIALEQIPFENQVTQALRTNQCMMRTEKFVHFLFSVADGFCCMSDDAMVFNVGSWYSWDWSELRTRNEDIAATPSRHRPPALIG